MLVINKRLVPKNFTAIALFPFVIYKDKNDVNNVNYNHAYTHIAQQKELLIIFFYLWYGIEYILRLLIYKDRIKAYKNICFEREAYKNQHFSGYNEEDRKMFAFLKYIF